MSNVTTLADTKELRVIRSMLHHAKSELMPVADDVLKPYIRSLSEELESNEAWLSKALELLEDIDEPDERAVLAVGIVNLVRKSLQRLQKVNVG